MRICVIHDWSPDQEQEMTWKDGLAAAVRILRSRHELKFFACGEEPAILPHPFFPVHVVRTGEPMLAAVREFAPDVILHWADMTRPNAGIGKELDIPQAVCFAGGDPFGKNFRLFDHVFCESNVYLQKFKDANVPCSTAFGTNTELFVPVKGLAKQFDASFFATFCDWKRHDLFSESVRGLRALAAGYMYQDHETYCWEKTMRSGVLTLPHVSADVLRWLLAATKVSVITSHWTGGSQRTVLESMAMNVPVVAMTDSDKTSEYVNECGIGMVVNPDPAEIRQAIFALSDRPVDSRKYILSKWTEKHYADALESGLKTLL